MTGVVAAVTERPGVPGVRLLLLARHRHPRVVGREGGVRGVGRHPVLGLHAGVGSGEARVRVLVAHHRGGGSTALGRSWKTGDWLLLDDCSYATSADGFMLIDHGVEMLDVVHSRGQDLNSADLLLAGSGGDGRS